MSENARSSRTSLWLIGVLCLAPVVASYFAFYFAPPARHTNYGELLATGPLPDARLELADGTPFQLSRLRGKWVLLMVDSGACDEFCRRKLFVLRQLRLTQGKDMERIERAWLIADDVPPAIARAVRCRRPAPWPTTFTWSTRSAIWCCAIRAMPIRAESSRTWCGC